MPPPNDNAPALSAIEARLEAVENQNETQTKKLDEALDLMRTMKTAIAGDQPLGITGLAATAKSAHRRIDEEAAARVSFELDTKRELGEIKAAAEREKWIGRIGSGVVGAGIAGAGLWLKQFFFGK